MCFKVLLTFMAFALCSLGRIIVHPIDGYDKHMIPMSSNDPLKVTVDYQVETVSQINSEEQTISMTFISYLSWIDERFNVSFIGDNSTEVSTFSSPSALSTTF